MGNLRHKCAANMNFNFIDTGCGGVTGVYWLGFVISVMYLCVPFLGHINNCQLPKDDPAPWS